MTKAELLRALKPDYSETVPVFGGISMRPAPAVEFALLMAESEDLADAVEQPNVALQSDEFIAAILDPAALRPVFERLVAASLPHVSPELRAKAVAATGVAFAHLALSAFTLALPLNVSSLFPSRKRKDAGWTVDPDPDDIASDVFKLATRLHASGYADAFSMSWTRLSFAAAIDAERETDRLERAAVAARVAQADKKGWRDFLKGLGR